MHVVTVETPALGDRSYLVHDGETGVVVDVQRDLDRMQQRIDGAGVRVTHVVETHIHNDYVSGGLALARALGAEYVVAADDDVAFDRRPVRDGDTITAGSLHVTVLATPGHTVHHVGYLVEDGEDDPAVFTGGNLLYGSVGRTDLVDPDLTDELTRQQYRSARRLADRLPPQTRVYPTHGFGSFCSSGPATAKDLSTLAEERTSNDALTTDDEDTFVRNLVAGLAAYPSYYAHMGPINRRGGEPADLEPPQPLDPDDLRRRLEGGQWVVDLRERKAYAAGHALGSLSFELGDSFTTYVGWVLPWGEDLVLVGETAGQVAEAQRDLSRIGIGRDVVVGAATGPAEALADGRLSTFPSVGWDELRQALGDAEARPVVVDVRRDDEFAEGHIEGAVNLPIHELLQRLDDAPDGRLWVHCASGYRAAVAASILERAGHAVVHVDDEWEKAPEHGLPVTSGG